MNVSIGDLHQDYWITRSKTVPQMGWAGVENGDLMRLAEKEFDVFITVDRNLSFQQNLSQISIVLLVLKASSNRIDDLAPFADLVAQNLLTAKKIKPLSFHYSRYPVITLCFTDEKVRPQTRSKCFARAAHAL